MLLKSFKRRVPRATAIVLQFNNIKRELSARGWKRGTGRTPSARDSNPHGDRRNEPRPANPLIPFIFLLSTITPFIFHRGEWSSRNTRRRFKEQQTMNFNPPSNLYSFLIFLISSSCKVY